MLSQSTNPLSLREMALWTAGALSAIGFGGCSGEEGNPAAGSNSLNDTPPVGVAEAGGGTTADMPPADLRGANPESDPPMPTAAGVAEPATSQGGAPAPLGTSFAETPLVPDSGQGQLKKR